MLQKPLIVLLWISLSAVAALAHAQSDEGQAAGQSADPALEALMQSADDALVRGWLVAPPGSSAMDLYQQALAMDPDNEQARAGLAAVYQAALEAALLLAGELEFEAAEDLLQRAEATEQASDAFEQARSRVQKLRGEHLEQAEQEARDLIVAGRFVQAEDAITDLIAIGLPRPRIQALRQELSYARLYGRHQPGQILRDPLDGDADRLGPAMVVIPSGQYMMGSPESESGRAAHEGPRHRIVLRQGFALAVTEITVAQFGEFIDSSDYTTDAEQRGWSRVYEVRSGRMSRRNRIHWRHDYRGQPAEPDMPVIHVSWRDARAYAQWLGERTGLGYRLPTEAEFEYALRARSQSRYWWGHGSPDEPIENLTGDGDLSPSGASWSVAFGQYSDGHWGPAPVGSYPANPFGLHDIGGNVMEWTEDCWHDSFVRAPSDGSAWVNAGCGQRVIRGGSWSSTPDMSRSAYRLAGSETSTDMRVGFRVARDL
ncbi:formylglycine-generating enzyme family protein [Wenzhouxiangella limi]|uniref:SUMF1/EgtB/PvdO family nonheme iron enzyme n=1 Tax=Wenzhouxiangella limi TaxID=2707351 RepID=A0A845UXD1_9GAMM|nr:formylglycine-generating enzyme family protein [Wenzhouxiangella limi]NDY95348.1 SUMF1/EgtB/PvdO family nonheme iron enzyme [Wenzhouxiangella limi]